jgi:hypothetical protein
MRREVFIKNELIFACYESFENVHNSNPRGKNCHLQLSLNSLGIVTCCV